VESERASLTTARQALSGRQLTPQKAADAGHGAAAKERSFNSRALKLHPDVDNVKQKIW
jgi:hypothetical protein